MQKTAPKAPPPQPGEQAPVRPTNLLRDTPLQAALTARDQFVVKVDARWGTDVLQTLVSPTTAAKFEKVRNRLDLAIEASNAAVTIEDRDAAVETAIATMEVERRGLIAMRDEAVAAGHTPLDPGTHWAFQLHDGTQALAVQTDADARAARRDPRFTGWAIYSMREIGVILSDRSLLGVLDVKAKFPTASIEAIKPAPDWTRGDEVGL